MKFSTKQIQSIAYRIKWTCSGCPENITYHDLKDELGYQSEVKKFINKDVDRDYLFNNIQLHENLISILHNLEISIDEFDRRRVALFHGMVQFPSTLKVTPPEHIRAYLNEFDVQKVQHEMSYIFITSLLDVVSQDADIGAREKLKLISDIKEGDDEESLFKHFMALNSLGDHLANVSTTMNAGSKIPIPKLKALKILFDFEDYDFQDLQFKGGSSPLGKTRPLDLRKKNILAQIEKLRGLTISETIDELS